MISRTKYRVNKVSLQKVRSLTSKRDECTSVRGQPLRRPWLARAVFLPPFLTRKKEEEQNKNVKKLFTHSTKLWPKVQGLILLLFLFLTHVYAQNSDTTAAIKYLDSASIMIELARYDEALEFYSKSLIIELEVYGENHAGLAFTYNSIGICYDEMGDLGKALSYYQKALEVWLTTLGDHHPNTAKAYHNIGNTHSDLGNYNEALDYLGKALSILGEKHPQTAIPYYNIGRTYWNKKDYEKALFATYKSFELTALDENRINLAKPYSLLGNIHHSMEDYKKAIEYYEKAIEVSIPVLGEKHPNIALSQTNIGQAYFELREYQKSLNFLQMSLKTRLTIFREGHPLLTTSYENISRVYARTKHLKAATEYSDKALKNLEMMRQKYHSALTKQIHLSSHYSVFEHAIDLQIKLDSMTSRDANWQKTFMHAEKAKSNILLEAFHTSQAKSFANIPDSLLQKEYDLSTELTFYEKKHFEEVQKEATKNDSLLSAYQQRLFDLNQAYEILIKQFEEDYPEYYQLKYDMGVVSVHEVQKKLLQPNQALIEYFVGDSSIFVFLIKNNDYQIHQIKKDFPLESWVQQMRRGIYDYHLTPQNSQRDYSNNNETFVLASHQLYEKLIASLGGDLPQKLIIIPDGVLGYLPFDALLTEQPKQNHSFKSHAYLLQAHEISYSYSATLLGEMKQGGNDQVSKRLLAIAPSFEENASILASASTQRDKLGPLMYNIPEAESIHSIFGGDLFSGAAATKSTFTERYKHYQILHLATHGKANDKIGDYSFLAFAISPDSAEDHKLYVQPSLKC